MAKAIFHKDFNFTPKGEGASWRIFAGGKAQSFPQRVIDAAVDAGAATAVDAARSKKTT